MLGCSTLWVVLAAAAPLTGEVVLPLANYDALVARAGMTRGPGEPPPVESSIRDASYTVSVDGAWARVRLVAQVDVLAPRAVAQRLLGSAGALLTASVDGKPAGVRVVDEHYALELLPGTHAVVMEVVVPVRSDGPSELELALPEALAARLNADLPGAPLAVTMAGVAEPEVHAVNGRTSVRAALPVGVGLSLSWVRQGEGEEAPEEEAPAPAASTPGKARAVVLHHVAVDESVMRGTVRATLNVQKGTRAEAVLTLPAFVEVLDVQAPDLREWTATPEGERKRVLVSLKYGHTGEFPVTVRYERALKDGGDRSAVPVPEVTVLDVESERGFLGVEAAPGVEVALARSEGAEALDGRDLPADLWSMSSTPLVLGVKYLEHPVNVALTVSQRAKVPVADTTLDRADFETVVNAEGRAVSAVNFHVRNHQRQYLEVKLAQDTTVLSCFVSGKAVRPARGEQDTLYIPLDRSTAAEGAGASFPVELVIAQDTGRLWPVSSLDLEMPATAVQAMDLSWRVFIPASHLALTLGGNFSPLADPRTLRRWLAGWSTTAGQAHAGGMSRSETLEGYDFSQGVKARFAQKAEAAEVVSAVRMSRPLSGRQYDLRANLLRAEAPHLRAIIINRDALVNLGRLSVLLGALAALLVALRRHFRSRLKADPAAPVPNPERRPWNLGAVLLGVALPLALLVGLYLDGVVMDLATSLLVWPGSAVLLKLRSILDKPVRFLAWPPFVVSLGCVALALLLGMLAETLVGAACLLLLAALTASLAHRWAPHKAPATAAPPTGTPVAAMAEPTKTPGGAA